MKVCQLSPLNTALRWPNLERGTYSIAAVATDGSDASTTSAPIVIKVSTIPKVSLITPVEPARFPELTNVSVIAKTNWALDEVKKVDLYANGKFIGQMSNDELDLFRFTWRSPRAGIYTLKAVATNAMGVTGESVPVKMIVVGSPRKD